MMSSIVLTIGEKRHVKLLVYNIKQESFSIQEARYELINKKTGEVEDSGEANYIDNTIDVVIEPKFPSLYDLSFIYRIGDEILIDCAEVYVMLC